MTPASRDRAFPRLPRILLPLCAAVLACAVGAAPAMARPLFPSATSPLSVQITSRPPAYSQSSSAHFAWKAVSATSVACRLNGHTYAPCKSGHTYRNLRAGLHTFRVRVKRNGKTRVAIARWTVDVTRPTIPTVSGGSSSWVTGSADLSASGSTDVGSGLAGYQYRVSKNGALWTAPAAGSSTTIAASGSYQVEFRAHDRAGNVSPWSAPAPALVDNSAPSAPALSGAGAGWQSVDHELVSAAGSSDAQSGVAFYQFRTSTDAGTSWSSWAPGTDVAVTDEGQTLVQVEAVDGVGNVSSVSQAQVAIDRSAPSVPAVTGGSNAWQSAASVNVAASGSTDGLSGVAGYQYETSTDDGATWSQPVDGASAPISAEGTTEVQFRTVDAAGNSSAWSAVDDQSTVMLDHTAPSVPSVGGGSWNWLSAASETITASGATDAVSGLTGYQYETSNDGGVTWSQPSWGSSLMVSAEGQTLVQFRALDAAGNASNWTVAGPASTVMLDRSAPSVPAVSGGSASWQNTASVNVLASGSTDGVSGVSGYQYETSTDGGSTWSQPVNGASASVSAEGTTEVQFRAVDGAGNTSAWSAGDDESTVMLDRSAPSVPSVSGGSSNWLTAASRTISASGSIDPANGSGFAVYQYESSTDGGINWSGPASGSSLTVSAEGQTLVQFRAVDNAGNASAWSPVGAGSTVKLDRTAPVVGATGGSSSWLNAPSVTVSVSASDPLSNVNAATYKYRTSTNNGSTWSAPAAGGAVTISAAGTTVVQFQVADQAGNVSAWAPQVSTAGATVKLDTVKPTKPAIVSGGSTTWSSAASRTITASGSTDVLSGIAGYQYETSLNNGAWSAPQSGSSAAISAEGTTKVQFRSVDNAGNVSDWTTAGSSATVRLDRTAPTVPTVTGGSTTCTRGTITIRASSTDSGSGVAGYHYRTSTNGGTTWSTPGTGSSVRFRTKGTWIVQFQAYDAAGNTSIWAPATAGPANTACHS